MREATAAVRFVVFGGWAGDRTDSPTHWGRARTRIQAWRLQPRLLLDPPFRHELSQHISAYFKLNNGTASPRALEWDAPEVVVRGICMSAMAWDAARAPR
ncbi:hypothetical protein NDU88_000201 [Pleurodeles waltl]|uniref:Uncharacterized protein n=1 Tax=Pleurodeles waltl TaxID=8319 RepID=A0AAV7VTZ4_PLEWA|nr:hypothetical protein NDU88_000201 [Pleurodeles waltl]